MNSPTHILISVFLGAAAVSAQAVKPAFEVASVKQNTAAAPERGGFTPPRVDRLTLTNAAVRDLIAAAYRRRAFDPRRVVGGPGWVDTDRFDINAKIPDGSGSLMQLYLPDGKGSSGLAYLMMRTLLEERFKLKVHEETRVAPIYALVFARRDGKTGPALVQSDVDCDKVLAEQADSLQKTGRLPPVPVGRAPACSLSRDPGNLIGNDVTMQMLADALTERLKDRPVVDRTGLRGSFQVHLEWAPDERALAVGGVSVVTALQEQLGLKLESTRGPVDVLVIDHVEHPTPD